MLQTSTGNASIKPYQSILLTNVIKRHQSYEDILGRKDRIAPNMQQVINTDMERMKTNKVYDRKLNRDLYGPKGLNWQCKEELQRLRDDERLIERDLMRLNRDLAKTTSLPPISRSPALLRNQAARLSAIAEERSSISNCGPIKTPLERSISIRSPQPRSKHLIPLSRRSMLLKSNPSIEPSHVIPKQTFQQLIAKTSDDRLPYQQPKFKQFPH